MKFISIFLGILIALGLFVTSDCFGGGKKGQRSNRKRQRSEMVRETAKIGVGEMEGSEAEALSEDVEFDSEDAYIKSLDLEIQEKINRADRLLAIGRKDEAIKIFENVADCNKIPLVFERLGDIYLEMVDEDPYNAVIAQEYFKMALENGFMQVIEKLLNVGDVLGALAKGNRQPPMSAAAMSMYS